MSLSPLAYADSLRIGTIDFVSPDEIKVLIDIEAPDGVALNTGTPRPFPRINGYVLIPSDEGYLVAQVEWITIERSQSFAICFALCDTFFICCRSKGKIRYQHDQNQYPSYYPFEFFYFSHRSPLLYRI